MGISISLNKRIFGVLTPIQNTYTRTVYKPKYKVHRPIEIDLGHKT